MPPTDSVQVQESYMDASPEANPGVAIVHLVRAGNAPAALSRFLDSYLQYPAGLPHRLVFLLKGFGAQLPAQIARQMERVPHGSIHCDDRGYDIASYFYAAARISEPLVVFVNSFSVVLADQWLAKLHAAYRQSGAGLVGATGSWESISIEAAHASLLLRSAARAAGLPLRVLFPGFPNPHVRTNAFLLARKEFLGMRPGLLRTKLGAWLFESGRNSMTRQILRRGLQALVVGRDGHAYPPEEWSRSRTFWQSGQENLLVHDNRTLAYENGDAAFRARRCKCAWDARRR